MTPSMCLMYMDLPSLYTCKASTCFSLLAGVSCTTPLPPGVVLYCRAALKVFQCRLAIQYDPRSTILSVKVLYWAISAASAFSADTVNNLNHSKASGPSTQVAFSKAGHPNCRRGPPHSAHGSALLYRSIGLSCKLWPGLAVSAPVQAVFQEVNLSVTSCGYITHYCNTQSHTQQRKHQQ